VDRLLLNRHAPDEGSRLIGRDVVLAHPVDAFLRKAEGGLDPIASLEEPEQESFIRSAERHGRAHQGIENRLQVEGRPAQRLEDVAGRGLVVEGLLQLARACLHLVEQFEVRDRDDRLIGEGGHELDLTVSEWLHVRSCQNDDAEKPSLSKQRHPEHGALLSDFLPVQPFELGIGQHIRHVNGAFLERHAARHGVAIRRNRMAGQILDVGEFEVVGRREPAFPAFVAGDECVLGRAQPRRGFDDGVENRLQIGGRPADHIENVRSRRLVLERFLKAGGSILDLVEQPNVLDGDDRLVCESLEKCDLLVGERADLHPPDNERSNR
jgi:hypothetical protein